MKVKWGVPQIRARQLDDQTLTRVRQMGAPFHTRLALVEVIKLLDGNCRKDRTTFAGGTTVPIDWDTETAEIKPELQIV